MNHPCQICYLRTKDKNNSVCILHCNARIDYTKGIYSKPPKRGEFPFYWKPEAGNPIRDFDAVAANEGYENETDMWQHHKDTGKTISDLLKMYNTHFCTIKGRMTACGVDPMTAGERQAFRWRQQKGYA